MTQIPAFVLSIASLLLSLYTLWLTQMRRGDLKMTQPMLVFMGREGLPGRADHLVWPKIYLRTLLFCTADRGCIVENMHLVVHNEYGDHLFDFWAYGEPHIAKGSGLFVPRNGVSLHHHFVLNRRSENFIFASGDYRIEIFAKIVGRPKLVKLKELKVALAGDQSPTMVQLMDAGIFFEWDAGSENYVGRLERRLNRQ
ncbi:MAG TPA: hypothetical protein VGC16_05470 [Rhizomicrobium sp.]